MADLSVRSAWCHVLFAFDVGQSIDFATCRERVGGAVRPTDLARRSGAPTGFRLDAAPLRVAWDAGPFPVGAFRSDGRVELELHEFGAVSVAYAIAVEGSLAGLVELSCAISEETTLRADAEKQVDRLLAEAGNAIRHAFRAPMVEDYAVFEVRAWSGEMEAPAFLEKHGVDVARLLRSERGRLSAEETRDAIAFPVSYGMHDVVLADWNAALVVDPDAAATLAVLRVANVQLLEMRFLDIQLNRALDRAYEALTSPRRSLFPGSHRRELTRVGRLQVDGAILFERVGNALKLLGDQHLARVYRQAEARFHLAAWNADILRKLEALESIHQKMAAHASAARMEFLELLIILLIALSILLPFLT
ncbi:MAG: hypothetical protein ACT4PV_16225 [Planctomycetaceae bacterium]